MMRSAEVADVNAEPWDIEYRRFVREVEKKISNIAGLSYIEHAFDEINARLRDASYSAQSKDKWDPLVLFLYRHTEEAILEFDRDIDIVAKNSSARQKNVLLDFLKADQGEVRKYVAGKFEVYVKSRLLRLFGNSVELDYQLPNGRDADIRLSMDGKYYFLECSVRTDTDASISKWENGVRCGSEDPYSHCIDIYYKVFDKIAKNFDSKKSQMSEDYPNVLLISFYTPFSTLYEESIGVNWALEELFADQPSSRDFRGSLARWIDDKLCEAQGEGTISCTAEEMNDHRDSLFKALRKIGGIMLFDNRCQLKMARVNYLANEKNSLSHSEMAKVEAKFDVGPSWAI